MRIRVMSRKEAFTYCCLPHEKPTVMISVSDPNMIYDYSPYASDTNGVREILPLCFADADAPGSDVYGIEAEESDMTSYEDGVKSLRCWSETLKTTLSFIAMPASPDRRVLPQHC